MVLPYLRQHLLDKTFQGLYHTDVFDRALLIPYFIVLILLALRQQAAAELAPYRSRMPAMQIRQVEQQFLHKRLLEKFNLPRLSLFYMSQA